MDNNYHCLDPQHWLVKRSLVNGEIISSVTEKRKAEVRPHANIQESLFGCTAAYPRPDRCPVQVSKIREQAEDSNYRLSEYLERPMVSGYDANVENCTVPRSISNSEPANAQCQACKKCESLRVGVLTLG